MCFLHYLVEAEVEHIYMPHATISNQISRQWLTSQTIITYCLVIHLDLPYGRSTTTS